MVVFTQETDYPSETDNPSSKSVKIDEKQILFISLQKRLIDPESNKVQPHKQDFLMNKWVLKESTCP